MLYRLSDQLLSLSLRQAQARVDTVTLVPLELDSREALELASENRRDWMNARATLVDFWRQIEVAANDLRSGLDVTFEGDLSTTDNNPVRFRGPTGRLQVGLEFDAPLTRLAERNVYRETLIAYQQARRDYIAFEDSVSQSLRATLRDIRLSQLDFELQRTAVHVAIAQVELARIVLQVSPDPGPTSARDLVDALTSLLAAQNDLLRTWVDYQAQRVSLNLDLGTMELDPRGVWIDPDGILTAGPNRSEEPEQIPPGIEILPALELP